MHEQIQIHSIFFLTFFLSVGEFCSLFIREVSCRVDCINDNDNPGAHLTLKDVRAKISNIDLFSENFTTERQWVSDIRNVKK